MTASAPTSARSSKPLRLYGVAAYLPQAVRQGSLPARHERGFFRHAPSLVSSLTQWGGGDVWPSVVLVADDVDVSGLVSPEGVPLAVQRVPALCDRVYGAWHGQALRDIAAEKLAALLQDTDFAPPGGESARQFQARIGAWAEGADLHGTALFLARPAVVRAMAVHVLGGDSALTQKLDCAPATLSLFTRQGGDWRLRMMGAPLGGEN
ncbi:histidine phosphatase family protein [Acetobacter tropicalis]|uniref:histidine phosphatase family protein n=1 Tax=Acetobacter tropicalis TaxID=104102 RepID=UPI0007776D9A|nr:histidine phosphatase family protein [Acetobacter tropicalis]